MEEQIVMVEWDLIRVSPFQPRREFAIEQLQELADSIKAVGVVQPPVVRAVKNKETVLYYELIAGERRWRAAKLAGLKTLAVIVRGSTDEHAAKTTLIENIQRVDLDPMEMALAFKRLIEVFRMTQEEMAATVGKKRSTVANYLRLLTLPASVQQALSQGTISMGHAKAILSLNSPEIQQRLHDLIVEKKLTVREAEAESHRLVSKKRTRKRDPHIHALEERLKEKLQTKVTLAHRSRGCGKVVIHYHNLDELQRILNTFGVDDEGDRHARESACRGVAVLQK